MNDKFALQESGENSAATERKRKRKSRWGGQDTSVPPPVVLGTPPLQTQTSGNK